MYVLHIVLGGASTFAAAIGVVVSNRAVNTNDIVSLLYVLRNVKCLG